MSNGLTLNIDQRSNIYNLVHEARYYMIFFLTKPWNVHHFSCTPQVFLLLLHTTLPQHVLQVLLTQETHTEHSEHLLPSLLHLTLVKVRKLSSSHPKFRTLQFQEVRVEIFKTDLMMLAVDLYL